MFIDSSIKRTEVWFVFFGESDILSLCTSAPISFPSSDVLEVKAHQCLCGSLPKALHTHSVKYSGLKKRKRL